MNRNKNCDRLCIQPPQLILGRTIFVLQLQVQVLRKLSFGFARQKNKTFYKLFFAKQGKISKCWNSNVQVSSQFLNWPNRWMRCDLYVIPIIFFKFKFNVFKSLDIITYSIIIKYTRTSVLLFRFMGNILRVGESLGLGARKYLSAGSCHKEKHFSDLKHSFFIRYWWTYYLYLLGFSHLAIEQRCTNMIKHLQYFSVC